jgi:pimeloyl-ACP methyl ester carboxylesterase
MITATAFNELKQGEMMRFCAEVYNPLHCLIYLPTDFGPSTQLLIAVHGIKREAEILIDGLKDIAEQSSHALIVPIFDLKNFPAYQRMIDQPNQIRPDWLLNRLIMDWVRYFCCSEQKIRMFGFSGGAQFCHRYAYLNAERVSRVILGSAGWYTLPDDDIKYPYGLRRPPQWIGSLNLRKMIEIDFLTLVGDQDCSRDSSVRKGPRIDVLQGKTRLERAHTWCSYLNQARIRFGSELAEVQPQVIPGLDHDLGKFLKNPTVKPVLLSALSQKDINDEY